MCDYGEYRKIIELKQILPFRGIMPKVLLDENDAYFVRRNSTEGFRLNYDIFVIGMEISRNIYQHIFEKIYMDAMAVIDDMYFKEMHNIYCRMSIWVLNFSREKVLEISFDFYIDIVAPELERSFGNKFSCHFDTLREFKEWLGKGKLGNNLRRWKVVESIVNERMISYNMYFNNNDLVKGELFSGYYLPVAVLEKEKRNVYINWIDFSRINEEEWRLVLGMEVIDNGK